MATRNGVYYKLKDSPYTYNVDDITFVFSSKIHLEKFHFRREHHRAIINGIVSKRFDLKVDLGLYADLILYMKVESRGFLIRTESGEFDCQNGITFNGLKIKNTSLTGLSGILTQS
jgi:hypothetical protein